MSGYSILRSATFRQRPTVAYGLSRAVQFAIALVLCFVCGCSAISHPYTRTIEHKMEVLNKLPKNESYSVDLRRLGQTPPPEHLVSDGDILGIYIEGGPGQEGGDMPVRFPDDKYIAPAIGYPIPVRNGGFIRVPQVGVLHVRGMTVWQIEERIRHILTVERATHQSDKTQIHVSLMWKRAVNVMVVRQEELDITKRVSPSNGTDADRRSGRVVELPAFRNDVLNALLETGGLPNDQAENAVYIFKRNDRRLPGQTGIAAAAPMVPPVAYGSAQAFTNPSPVQLAGYQSFMNAATPHGPYANGPYANGPYANGPYTSPYNDETRHAGLYSAGYSVPTPVPHQHDSASDIQQTSYSQRYGPQNSMQPTAAAPITGSEPYGYAFDDSQTAVAQRYYKQANVGQPYHSLTIPELPQQQPGSYSGDATSNRAAPWNMQHACVPQNGDMNSRHPSAIRIPLTYGTNEMPTFSQNDVILEDGDIVLVESRENEYFYTAGLLGGAQYAMPRNQDIDVIDAVLIADTYSRSTQLNSPTRAIGGVSVLNRDVTVGASRVVIERKSADGKVERFRVSLYEAMKNADQRVIIEPGDRLYLEYTTIEASLAFFERHLLDPFLSGAPAMLTN